MPSRYHSRQLVLLSQSQKITKPHVRKMRSLIRDDDADPNHIMDDKHITMHNILKHKKIAYNVRYSAVSGLLDLGADANLVHPVTGETPLSLAAQNGYIDVILLLLKNGANVNAQDGNGNTALHYAVEQELESVVSWLIEQGAANGIVNKNSETAEDIAIRTGQGKVAQQISECHTVEEQRITSLFLAAAHNQKDVVERLLKHGGGVNTRDKDGNTPLHHAVKNGHEEMVETLVSHGAHINKQGEDKKTVLHLAAEKGEAKMVSCLMRFNAVNGPQNKDGEDAAESAAKAGHAELRKQILKHENGTKHRGLKNYVRGLRK